MNLAPTRGHCRLGTYGCNGSCAVKGCLIDKYAFQKNEGSVGSSIGMSFGCSVETVLSGSLLTVANR